MLLHPAPQPRLFHPHHTQGSPQYSLAHVIHPKGRTSSRQRRLPILTSGMLEEIKKASTVIANNGESQVSVVKLPGGYPIVAKRIPLFSGSQQKQILLELGHHRISKCLGHFQDDQHAYILSHFYAKGDLRKSLDKTGPMEEPQVKEYLKQILQALNYLHSRGIVHRDLKASNILLKGKSLVINDFGCSEVETTEEVEFKGSVLWMAPEALRQESATVKSDMWSLACTAIQMLTGLLPWSESHFDNQLCAVYSISVGNKIPQLPPTLSPQLHHILTWCLEAESGLRPSCQELLELQYFN